jgi:DMSO/TMAO reductase YedYZ molybdopterin-dependent catalytic subunit
MSIKIDRRTLIAGFGGSLLLSGCDNWSREESVQRVLHSSERLTMGAQRLISSNTALAREFSAAEMSPSFRSNGNRSADTPEYRAMLANGFAGYRLRVGGLVERPLKISLDQLRAMPSRTQITRHDCVEGWSAIGQWTGPQLSYVLDLAKLRDDARYIVFYCADSFGGTSYYESMDLADAYHPQTILAYGMNGKPLPEAHGAPIRVRNERQLGYKHAKYVMAVEAVASLAHIFGGKGGYWEDVGNYAWYAGI